MVVSPASLSQGSDGTGRGMEFDSAPPVGDVVGSPGFYGIRNEEKIITVGGFFC